MKASFQIKMIVVNSFFSKFLFKDTDNLNQSTPLQPKKRGEYHLESLTRATAISSLDTYNTAEKVAAAAAAVSSTSASVVEIPNFGQSLSSMMEHNKMVSESINLANKIDTYWLLVGECSNRYRTRLYPEIHELIQRQEDG